MIKIALLKFVTDCAFHKRDAEKLRGFFGNYYKEEDYFHNHYKNGKSIHRFPMIQYKVIDGNLSILSFGEAVKIVTDKFLNIDEILIYDKRYTKFEKQLSVNNFDLSFNTNFVTYHFDSPWLPIKQENYLDFINNKIDLNKILQNNILEIFKSLNIKADNKIVVNGSFKETKVMVNNIQHFGFIGKFESNVNLPNYIGLGKNKSIGFGTIKY